jgi:hypothetical protein
MATLKVEPDSAGGALLGRVSSIGATVGQAMITPSKQHEELSCQLSNPVSDLSEKAFATTAPRQPTSGCWRAGNCRECRSKRPKPHGRSLTLTSSAFWRRASDGDVLRHGRSPPREQVSAGCSKKLPGRSRKFTGFQSFQTEPKNPWQFVPQTVPHLLKNMRNMSNIAPHPLWMYLHGFAVTSGKIIVLRVTTESRS